MVHAVLCRLRAGGSWRRRPHDFPAWQAVSTRFRLWRPAGVWERAHDAPRAEVRLDAGHPPTPETLRVDRQTVTTTRRGGPKGYDGGKKAVGRKRFVAVDSLRLVWALLVTPARDQDRDAGRWRPGAARHRLPRVREVIADRGSRSTCGGCAGGR